MKKLRCESQADIFGKRDSHQWLVYMMVKWRLPCLENVINTLVWYNNTHISFAINYIALFLQSHPMWVARVPGGLLLWLGHQLSRSHPMWVARVPVQMHVSRRASVPLSHPMWVARVPVVNSFFVAIKNASSHPMWVARVPVSSHAQNEQSIEGRTPCGWRECPFATPRSNVNI